MIQGHGFVIILLDCNILTHIHTASELAEMQLCRSWLTYQQGEEILNVLAHPQRHFQGFQIHL